MTTCDPGRHTTVWYEYNIIADLASTYNNCAPVASQGFPTAYSFVTEIYETATRSKTCFLLLLLSGVVLLLCLWW